MDLNPDEARTKQAMAAACEHVYGIFDRTKWHRSALLSFVAADELDGIVTDAARRTAEVEAWRARGVEVTVVDGRASRRRSPGPAPRIRPREGG